MASLLPPSMSVEDILALSMEDLREHLIQKGINVKNVSKANLQAQLIRLSMASQTEDRGEAMSDHSRCSGQTTTQVESEAVTLKRLEFELELAKLHAQTHQMNLNLKRKR